MSKMSKLNLSIQEIAKDDEKLSQSITRQMQEYINGQRPLHKLSIEARYALETYETGNDDIIEEREIQNFRLPTWNELNALARIMLPVLLILIMSGTAIAKGHSSHHYHKSSIKAPKTWR